MENEKNKLILRIGKVDDTQLNYEAVIFSDNFHRHNGIVRIFPRSFTHKKDPTNSAIADFVNNSLLGSRRRYNGSYLNINTRNDFDLFLTIGTLPVFIQRKGNRFSLNGVEKSKIIICETLSRLIYKSCFEKDMTVLLSVMHHYLNMPENVRHVLENRLAYHFFDERYNRHDVLINVEQIGSDEFALEISDGVWGTINTANLNTMVNSYVHNKKRGHWKDLTPSVLFERLMGRPCSESEHKLMVEFLKQNRKDGIVEDKALELLREVNEKYDNIYVSWDAPDEEGNRYPKEVFVRGKGYDWRIEPSRYKASGTQDVRSYVWGSEEVYCYTKSGDKILDDDGKHLKVTQGGHWKGPICIDNMQSGSSIGDQFVARALAFLNDTMTVSRVSTIKRYLTNEPDSIRNPLVTMAINPLEEE
jgi:hypothetical protein